MPLIDLKTDLKSLKFGKDRPEGASSNEPFITKDIPDERKAAVISDGGPDFMLRGGVLAPIRAFDDLKRTKDLFFKTPKGLLFTAKMNLLSRMSPKTIATQGGGYAGGLVNQGIYLPLGLAAQTGLSFTGTHTNTFGINPFSPGQQNPSLVEQIAALGLVQYEKAILGVGGNGEKLTGGFVSPLANLYNDKIIIKSNGPNVVEYSGGPGAPLGIGQTQIRYSSISYGQSRTGDNNPLAVTDKDYFYTGVRPNSKTLSVENLANILSNFGLAEATTERKVTGKTDYTTVSGFGGTDNSYTYNITSDGGFTFENTDAINVYKRNDEGQPSLEPSNETPTNTANPTSDFISPRTNSTKYNDISGFGGASGDGGYNIDLSSDGGVTWENLDAQKVYQSGSLDYDNVLPPPNRPNGQTIDDFKNPLSTNYANILGFGGANGNYEDNISKDGGFTWDNTDAQKVYANSGSLEPNEQLPTPVRPNGQSTDDFIDPLSTNYADIEGFGGANGNYEDNISKDGGYTWNNVDARRIYNSGSLTPINNEITLPPQTTDDWVAPFTHEQLPTPAGPTRYTSMLNDGRLLNDVTNEGGVAWNDSQQKKTTSIRGNNPNTALMFNNNTVEVRARYKGINIFAEEGVGEGDDLLFRGLPLATKYPISNGFTKLAGIDIFNSEDNFLSGADSIQRYLVNGGVGQGVYKNGIAFGKENSDALETNTQFINDTGNGVSTMNQEKIENINDSSLYPQNQQLRDFRNDITDIVDPSGARKVLGKFNGNYHTSRIDQRTNHGDPGARRTVTDYTVGQGVLDQINASPIYEGLAPLHAEGDEDLCSFSIGYLQNNTSGKSFYLNFRAFLEDFSDDYTSEWGSVQYAGRGDKFYNYKGFDRSISLGWTVYAQSKEELIPMYEKLNYLASGLAPDYSSGGYMRGNLVRLTIGGYLYNQLGFFKSISYNISKDSTWEIGIDNTGGRDETVKQLPHMIKVSGVSFVPIQEFVPRIGNPSDLGKTPFISLADATGTSYTSTT